MKPTLSFTSSSVAQTKARMSKVARGAPHVFERAQYAETEVDRKECVKRTPKDTGDLRDSIKTLGPVTSGGRIETAIATDVSYAVPVHEILDAFHPIGQAKFIESVINESQRTMGNRLATRIRSDMDKL